MRIPTNDANPAPEHRGMRTGGGMWMGLVDGSGQSRSGASHQPAQTVEQTEGASCSAAGSFSEKLLIEGKI